jgi:tetratricopeptide (TPR) repeat protein
MERTFVAADTCLFVAIFDTVCMTSGSPSKTTIFLVLGAVLVIGAFILGAVFCFSLMATQKTWMAFFSSPTAPHSNLSAKARLPDDMRETAQQAIDYFKKHQFTEAAESYQKIIDKYPDCLYAWSNLGVTRFQQGNLDQAMAAFQKAVTLSPEDAFSWANLGVVFYQLKQYDDAISALKKAVMLNPNDARSHNYLGCCEAQVCDTEEAKKEYKRATELDPNFGDAYFNLALVYATAKPPDGEQARAYYKQARDLGVAKDPRLEKIINGTGDQ